jgi:type IV pilus assembly protein PilW
MQDSFSRVQENGRFALNAILRDLRGAGYLGCSSGRSSVIASTKNDNSTACSSTYLPEALFGTDCGTSIAPDYFPAVSFPIEGVEGASGAPDALVVRFSDAAGARVIQHTAKDQPLTVTGQANLAAGDTVVVSDCEHAAVFGIASITSGNILTPDFTTREPDLGKRFINAEISKYTAHTYSIGDGAANDGTGPVRALFRSVDGGATAEFIEGIEDLQVLYGLDTNNDGIPNDYRNATNVGALWPNVVSVRVTLTARSVRRLEEADNEPLRQVFTATVALRNKLG